MNEKARIQVLLGEAGKELGISPDNLTFRGKQEVVLTKCPVIRTGEPLKELSQYENALILHTTDDLARHIMFVVSPHTAFRRDDFTVNINMLSAFLDMLTLRRYYPNIELYLPEAIEYLSPGVFYPKSIELRNKITFRTKVFMPPDPNSLRGEVAITFNLRAPSSHKVHTHVTSYKLQ